MQKTKTILVVDDDKSTVMLYRDIFELENHNVVICTDGAQAIHEYVDKSPDLTIMDLDMPIMDGCKSIWHIKEYDPNAKIIIITGYFTPSDECELMEERYKIPFYKKPIKAAKLLSLLQPSNTA